MCKFSPDSKAKIGNAIIYIANHTGKLSKTKLLKLLYIMEYTMVRKYHAPFLAVPYEVWKWGGGPSRRICSQIYRIIYS